ncbi:MAG: hypothetical protein ABI584_08530 [Acidobacteriota bacterium]
MDAVLPPDPAGEPSRILHALRHALADPLSAAALKLDLVERRLLSPSGADPSWMVERVRAVQADVGTTSRLLDLLLRLADIAAERPEETSLRDVCRAAGVPLDGPEATLPPQAMRPRSSAEAIRSVASFTARRGAGPPATGRARLEDDRVTLSLEGSQEPGAGRPQRLLDLPHGIPEAGTLFVARAAVAADGGHLEISERDGRLVALFSWPVRPEAGRRGDA